MRPKRSVTPRIAAAARLSASAAGISWIFTVQPNHFADVPVKSRKHAVTASRKNVARTMRMMRSLRTAVPPELLDKVVHLPQHGRYVD